MHWLGKDAALQENIAPENSWWIEDGFILLNIKGEVFPAVA